MWNLVPLDLIYPELPMSLLTCIKKMTEMTRMMTTNVIDDDGDDAKRHSKCFLMLTPKML